MPAQQRRRRHHKTVPAPVWEQPRERRDERTVGGAKPRSLLLTSQNRELVPQQHELHVLVELSPTAADQQPQICGKGKVSEGEEHRAILPGPPTWLGVAPTLRRSEVSGIRARASNTHRGTYRSDRAEPQSAGGTLRHGLSVPNPARRHKPRALPNPCPNLDTEF
jgi:hypothetical protein